VTVTASSHRRNKIGLTHKNAGFATHQTTLANFCQLVLQVCTSVKIGHTDLTTNLIQNLQAFCNAKAATTFVRATIALSYEDL